MWCSKCCANHPVIDLVVDTHSDAVRGNCEWCGSIQEVSKLEDRIEKLETETIELETNANHWQAQLFETREVMAERLDKRNSRISKLEAQLETAQQIAAGLMVDLEPMEALPALECTNTVDEKEAREIIVALRKKEQAHFIKLGYDSGERIKEGEAWRIVNDIFRTHLDAYRELVTKCHEEGWESNHENLMKIVREYGDPREW